jgi:hypothetical protein
MINTRYPYPLLPVSGQVLKAGQYGDLKMLSGSVSVGLFDARTYGIATPSGNGDTFFIGYSSTNTRDQIAKFMFGATSPNKGHDFRGKDVISFEFSKPTKRSSDIWTIGYDGSIGCNDTSCGFECGKTYGIRIELSGSPIYRAWAKQTQHEIYVTTPCCDSDACATGCPDNKVDCGMVHKMFAEKINSHIELSRQGVKAWYRTSDFAATAATGGDYCMSLCDEGSVTDLANVQAVVGTAGKVVRSDRKGSTSTYKVMCINAAPTAYTPIAFNVADDCGTCLAGYTLVPKYNVYTIIRPLAGTEDLTTPTLQNTFADGIGTTYGATAPNTTFLSSNGATASIQIKLVAGTAAPAAKLADTVVKTADEAAKCTPAAGTPIAWTQCGTSYKVKRKMCMTLPRKECGGANWLTELQAQYATDTTVVAGSITVVAGSTGCADAYQIEQWSGCMSDICLAKDTSVFQPLQGFHNGMWEEIVVAHPAYDPTRKCGLELTAELPEQFFSDCAFDVNDLYETDGIRMEVSWVSNQITGLQDNCSQCYPRAKKKKSGTFSRQSGEWLLREYLNAGAYLPYGDDGSNPRFREVMDQNRRGQVDRKAFYNVYYIQYRTNHGLTHNFDEKSLVDEAMIAFKEGDPKEADFIVAFAPVLSKFGVTLQERK